MKKLPTHPRIHQWQVLVVSAAIACCTTPLSALFFREAAAPIKTEEELHSSTEPVKTPPEPRERAPEYIEGARSKPTEGTGTAHATQQPSRPESKPAGSQDFSIVTQKQDSPSPEATAVETDKTAEPTTKDQLDALTRAQASDPYRDRDLDQATIQMHLPRGWFDRLGAWVEKWHLKITGGGTALDNLISHVIEASTIQAKGDQGVRTLDANGQRSAEDPRTKLMAKVSRDLYNVLSDHDPATLAKLKAGTLQAGDLETALTQIMNDQGKRRYQSKTKKTVQSFARDTLSPAFNEAKPAATQSATSSKAVGGSADKTLSGL